MDYMQQFASANINSNINTGNISTDDFLAIFSSSPSSPTDYQQQFTNNNNITAASTTISTAYGSGSSPDPSLSSAIYGTTTLSFNDTLLFINNNFNTNSNYFFTNNNTPNGNVTTTIQYNDTYPSGYTLTHIIIASIIVTILMIIIVVGNMLVIIAIATEKSLKNIQNWFIASLAVADFFLGLIIMPFSLANELMGYWIFGSWWCDIHSAMDVLLCTASIMNLCLISLDRYWSITKAVEYLKSRTPARAALMIASVWIMSGLICIPPLLGWKVKRPEGNLPQCALSEDIGYVLYSALGSFYIPSCIMVFVYIRIYFAAKARARRGIKKQPRKPPNEQVKYQMTSFTTSTKGTIPMPSVPGTSAANIQRQIATIENQPNAIMAIPTVTCDLASDISTSEAAEVETHQPPPPYSTHPDSGMNGNDKETLKVSTIATTHNAFNALPPPSGLSPTSNSTKAGPMNNNGLTTSSPNELKVSPVIAGRCRALSVGIDTDMVSEFDPSSSDSGVVSRCAVVKPLKFRLCQPIFGRKNQRRNEAKTAAVKVSKPSETAELEPAIPKVQKPRDPEKEKRRIARKKEKRATLILGLIMGSFIACWLPFFFLYILMPACNTHCTIPDSAFAIAFWLGYMNSALNPAIYTIFNKDFRRAFRRILFK
ncbi:alpha-2C adrenergic receptor [Episyrphus balteatus]|uniref:alpha-2C adrenergic receptor n=1 Tax=Episyrphus balteatus TaxID=286459 RepID=UPI0024856997|nr:alpha-2C adrenergic receptor [Episyrphus balteatus]